VWLLDDVLPTDQRHPHGVHVGPRVGEGGSSCLGPRPQLGLRAGEVGDEGQVHRHGGGEPFLGVAVGLDGVVLPRVHCSETQFCWRFLKRVALMCVVVAMWW